MVKVLVLPTRVTGSNPCGTQFAENSKLFVMYLVFYAPKVPADGCSPLQALGNCDIYRKHHISITLGNKASKHTLASTECDRSGSMVSENVIVPLKHVCNRPQRCYLAGLVSSFHLVKC